MNRFNPVLEIYAKQLQSLINNQNVDMLTKRANEIQKIINSNVYQNQIDNALKVINNSDLINYTRNITNISGLEIASANPTKKNSDNYNVNRINDYAIVSSLVENISTDETDKFFNLLSEYPFLAYKYETGKKIYKAIAQSSKTIFEAKHRLYRVRIPTKKNIPYSFREMFTTLYGRSTHGRFSFIGANYLYFSESLQDALLETKADIDKKYTYILVENRKDFNVLDITNLKIPLFSRCHIVVDDDDSSLKTEYLIPNYIANCAHENNFDGILYNSVSGKGKNIVLFGSGYSDFNEIETVGKNY